MSLAGEMRHRLLIEEPIETPDSEGGMSRSFAPLTMIWAKIDPLRGRGDVEFDALQARITHRITIRSGVDLSLRHRLSEGGRYFIIHAFRAPADDRLIEIDAEERID